MFWEWNCWEYLWYQFPRRIVAHRLILSTIPKHKVLKLDGLRTNTNNASTPQHRFLEIPYWWSKRSAFPLLPLLPPRSSSLLCYNNTETLSYDPPRRLFKNSTQNELLSASNKNALEILCHCPSDFVDYPSIPNILCLHLTSWKLPSILYPTFSSISPHHLKRVGNRAWGWRLPRNTSQRTLLSTRSCSDGFLCFTRDKLSHDEPMKKTIWACLRAGIRVLQETYRYQCWNPEAEATGRGSDTMSGSILSPILN